MTRPEHLFTAEKKAVLAAAARKRYSCRAYADELTKDERTELTYLAQRYTLPGCRLRILRVGEDLFTGTVFNMGRVTGCTSVAVVIADTNEPLGRIHAGLAGEALCLEAVRMGLGTCWIAGTLRRKLLQVDLKAGETIPAVIALGHPADPDKQPERRRRAAERLCTGNTDTAPEAYRRAAELVRIAPSALNMQPWSMRLQEDSFLITCASWAQLETGIALCHAELALTAPHTWQYEARRSESAARATEKGSD